MDPEKPQFRQVPHQMEMPASNRPPKAKNKNVWWLLALLLLTIACAVFIWFIRKDDSPKITSFAECKAAGNPIAESYPEQCLADGQSFTNPDQKAEQPNSEQSATTPTAEQKFLTIKEWDVRFPLTKEIEDANYFLNEYVYFGLASLSGTDCAADKVTLGALTRFTADQVDPMTEEPYLSVRPDAKKIGNFYFFYTGPQAACSEDDATLTKADNAKQDIINALKNLEAVPAD